MTGSAVRIIHSGRLPGLAEVLDDAQPLGRLLAPLLALGGAHLAAQLAGHALEVELGDDVAHGLGAHAAGEDVAPALGELTVAVLAEQLLFFERLDVVEGTLHLGAQGVLLGVDFAAQGFELAAEVAVDELTLGAEAHADVGLLLVGLGLQRVDLLLDEVVDDVDVVVGGELVLAQHGLARPGEELVLGRLLAGVALDPALQLLRLGDDGGGLLVDAGVEAGDLLALLAVEGAERLVDLRLEGVDLLLDLAVHALHAHLELALVALDGARAGVLVDVGDDVLRKVEHALEVARADVEQQAQAGGHALDVPDVRDGRGELDVAHALAAHARGCDLDAALVADDALVAHALVLAAGAFPVTRGAEDPLAEEPVAFGAQRAVVNRLRLGHLAVGPVANLLGRGQGDTNCVEILYFHCSWSSN